MINQNNINKDIIPTKFPDRGENSEKMFQRKLREVLLNFGLKEIKANLITNEFYSFDALGFPQYSLLRTDKNILYLKQNKTQEIKKELFAKIGAFHKERFGYDLNCQISNQTMLISHTTSAVMESLLNSAPDEIFVISKTFRSKTERKEKTQIDICLCDRTLPEVISFVENLYSTLLNKKIKISLMSDFYFFCEPSFSFSVDIDNKKIMLGSGGFVRDEVLNFINKTHFRQKKGNIIFIGFPYQKILNLALGRDYDDWNIDYNTVVNYANN